MNQYTSQSLAGRRQTGQDHDNIVPNLFSQMSQGGNSYELYACIYFRTAKGLYSQHESFQIRHQPMLDKLKSEKSLKSYSIVQTGKNSGLMTFEFANKTKMNKSLKEIAAHRNDIADDTGMQWWAYHGTVKASG